MARMKVSELPAATAVVDADTVLLTQSGVSKQLPFSVLRTGVASAVPPVNADDAGTPGTIAYDTEYVYVCVAVDTWRRAALATWVVMDDI